MTNKILNSLLILAVAGGLVAGSAVAQNSNPTSPAPAAGPGVVDPGHPRVNQVDGRLENQKDRIQQGVKNGTLTPEEAHRLVRNDRRIANQENKAMAANGGHLTKSEQKGLNKELNHNSKAVYKAKH